MMHDVQVLEELSGSIEALKTWQPLALLDFRRRIDISLELDMHLSADIRSGVRLYIMN